MSQIKITKYNNKIKISGHSMPHVCAGISSTVYTSVNMINTIVCPNAILFEDNGDYVLLTVKSRKKVVSDAITVMMQMFSDIAKQSPEGTVVIEDLREGL